MALTPPTPTSSPSVIHITSGQIAEVIGAITLLIGAIAGFLVSRAKAVSMTIKAQAESKRQKDQEKTIPSKSINDTEKLTAIATGLTERLDQRVQKLENLRDEYEQRLKKLDDVVLENRYLVKENIDLRAEIKTYKESMKKLIKSIEASLRAREHSTEVANGHCNACQAADAELLAGLRDILKHLNEVEIEKKSEKE